MTNLLELQVPYKENKILLHSCCAPCSCSVLQRMVESGIEPTVYFYNPNIFPREEYDHRKQEVIRYAQKVNVPFVDGDYKADLWFEKTQGHEKAPERGERCDLCFEMRLGEAAAYAARNSFKVFTTSLGISRWKDLEQVNRAGEKAASLFPGLIYWAQNWRMGGGQELMRRLIEEEKFYRQRYCGCLYSFRGSLRRDSVKHFKDQPAR